MKRLALFLALFAVAAPAFSLSAYVPGESKKEKKKEKDTKLKPSAFGSGGVTTQATELRESSKGGLTGPAESMSQTAAATSAGGGGATGGSSASASAAAPAAASDAEKKGVEAAPQKKAPPKLRGR